MTVTGLRPDARASGWLVIEVDGARLGSLPVERVRALGLKQGMKLDADGRARLEAAVQAEKAYAAATRTLAARPRASYELRRRLHAKGHRPGAVAEAVGRLESAGLLDDFEFARHFARVRQERGLGPSRLLTELLRRGVERTIAERAIAEAMEAEGVDPLERVAALARKRAHQLRDVPTAKRFRRVLAYLQRRGHSGSDVVALVRRIAADEESGRD